eukprot:8090-Heterococcus_DN1.PRE.5
MHCLLTTTSSPNSATASLRRAAGRGSACRQNSVGTLACEQQRAAAAIAAAAAALREVKLH